LKYLLKKARAVCSYSGLDREVDVLVEDGIITRVEKGMSAPKARSFDLADKLLFPGFIDLHAHLREPGNEEEETLESGARSAVRGGYVAIVVMPNTMPPLSTPFLVRSVIEASRHIGFAALWPAGTLTRDRAGEAMAELGLMLDAGAVGFTDDGDSVADAALMRAIMQYAAHFGCPLMLHEEDPSLSAGGHLHEGRVSSELGIKGNPSSSESVMVARDVILAAETGARIHIQHVSARETVEIVRRAKREAIHVTAEATPHHLILTEDACRSFDTNCKVNPPLRSEADRAALVEALVDGTIDAVATDHAPHLAIEKDLEFALAPPGMIGLETAVPLMYSHFVEPGILDLHRFCELFSVGPAHVLRRDPFVVREGVRANLTVIDPTRARVVDPRTFVSKSRNTPFAGWELRGWPTFVIADGRLILEDGRLVEGGEIDG